MRSVLLNCCAMFLGAAGAMAQPLYFPPATGEWNTINPNELGWCNERIDSLYQFLEVNQSKAFILLKDGKIVLENYFNGHSETANWYWASAGKTLTAFMVGQAQQQGLLDIDEPTSNYLGQGWTSCTAEQEQAITIRNQLSMTTGLNDEVADDDCTDSPCLEYLANAGSRWAYHNAPYTLLDGVITNATSKTLNAYISEQLLTKIGMDGSYLKIDLNNVFFSTPRSMARFGLLLLNKGKWDQTQLIPEDYLTLMTTTSQNINLSYGYLTWLNGKASSMVPGSQVVFPGEITSNAPDDMFAAMGKNGQLINVVPSKMLVMIRMGDVPDASLVPLTFQNEIWAKLNSIIIN